MMMRIKIDWKYISVAILGLFFLLPGCMEEKLNPNHATVIVQVKAPEGLVCDLSGIQVQLQHTQLTVGYTAVTDQEGKARFDVEYGFYRAQAQYDYTTEYKSVVINASSESFIVSNADEHYVEMESVYPRSEQLVFKEIYYSCCKGADGKNYLKDQYLIIYNNSSDVAYLDSICIGFLDPMNASSSPKGWEGLPYLPVYNFMWMFPGAGTDHPLQPGEQAVVGINGINHIALGNTNSVDLSKEGYWAMYDEKANLTNQSVPAPGVVCMQNIWKFAGTAATCSTISPAWIMWKINNMSVDEFLEKYLVKHPINITSNTRYMTVPVEWVYDGVECFRDADCVKRLPAAIDNGFSVLPEGIGSGYSVHRVKNEQLSTPERTVYMDTNDSSKDFVKQIPSLKN